MSSSSERACACRVWPVLIIVLSCFFEVDFLGLFFMRVGVGVFVFLVMAEGLSVVLFWSIVSMTSSSGPASLFLLMSVMGIHLVGAFLCLVAVSILILCFLSSLRRSTLARLSLNSLICAGWSLRR